MATIRDVAQRAGVSAGTVSNVLNRPSYVSAEMRRRVLDAIAELDFAPTKSARQYRPGRERVLGMAIADLGNPFFVDIGLAADQEARRRGVGVVIVHSDLDVTREEHSLDLLIQLRVHGIMITPVDDANPRLEELLAQGIPLVYVDRITGDRPCCWVTSDDRAGGRIVAEHLLGLGRQRLAFVGGSGFSSKVEARWQGFRDAVGAPVDRIETESWSLEDGRRAGAAILARPAEERPGAVFCANDLIALGMMQVLQDGGVRVPEDIALAGYDDLAWSDASTIPITTVDQHRAELGRIAVGMIMDEIEQGSAHEHRHVLLEPRLVVRASTERPA